MARTPGATAAVPTPAAGAWCRRSIAATVPPGVEADALAEMAIPILDSRRLMHEVYFFTLGG